MLTPEIIELCKQASVEQDLGRLLYLVSEISRLIEEHHKRFTLICDPESEDQTQNLKSHTPAGEDQVAPLA